LSVTDVLKKPYELFDLTKRVLWNGLYKREIIANYRILFDESILAGMEDFLFNINFLSHINEIVYIPDKLLLITADPGKAHHLSTVENTVKKY